MININVTNEIGKVIVDSGLETYVANMLKTWIAAKTASSSWFSSAKADFVAVTNFLLTATDDVVNYVEALPASGPDKKATVIDTVTKLYDKVVPEALPIWLKPFSGIIRDIIIGQVLPAVVDFVASKLTTTNPVVNSQMFGVPGREDLNS